MSNANVIEAMLLRWGESHASGRTVTLLLPDDGEAHPFKGLKCGPEHGQRLAVSIALIADDETLRPPPKTGNLGQRLSIKCTEPTFRRFLWERGDIESETLPNEEDAKIAVRRMCGVVSRANIDGNPEAERKAREILGDYAEFIAL